MRNFLWGIGIFATPLILAIAAPTNFRKAALTPVLGNYPNASLSLSTDTTVTPDAPPTNTTSINVSTSTNFKGKLEGYPTTGVVRVTDAHPAGTYTVTVRAFDSGGASATKTFALTVTTPVTCVPVRFATTSLVAGHGPQSATVGDFNGDGKQDLAVANSNTVAILLGNGAGGFSAPTDFAGGGNSHSVSSSVVGDFNGDGKQDLAVINYPNSLSILLGDGAGGFTTTNYAIDSYAVSIAVGDFNGDGKQDLAVANYGTGSAQNTVSILLGDGAGGFSARTNFAVGTSPASVVVGDFNNDGNQDLAVVNTGSNNVSILLGNGDGSFSAPTNFPVGGGPLSMAMGDFNGDGNQDLAVANSETNTVSILLGDGKGGFSVTNLAVGTYDYAVAVGDFDGDGKQDLAVVNYLISNTVSILLGDGKGGFSAPIDFAVGIGPVSVAVGDFNADGKQDLVLANYYSKNVSVLRRVCDLTLTGAVSRKTHAGGTGTFDINLPLTGSPGIECRTTGGTNDYTIVVTFSGAVTVTGTPQAQVTSGTGCVGSAGTCNGGTVAISANTVTIPLTNVANAQTINVTLFDVSNGSNVVIPMGVLTGDVNGNGTVNAADVAFAKAHLGQVVDGTNFRGDVNASGIINATDVSIIKSHLGTGLP
jgi:FG-GAP-like repeat/Dockerin type I domain/FG-GAP repeat